MSLEKSAKKEFFSKFFMHATTRKIRCIDERPAEDQNNGVQIEGATSGLVDAYKAVTGVSEDAAWDAMRRAGIPLDGHVGDHGCGYNGQAENSPENVGAPERVSSASRVERVMAAKGNLLHYVGDHNPKYATINYMKNKTLDTNSIVNAGEGTFNLDAWAIDEFAKKLQLDKTQTVAFRDHIINSYQKTVTTLTHGAISTFIVIK